MALNEASDFASFDEYEENEYDELEDDFFEDEREDISIDKDDSWRFRMDEYSENDEDDVNLDDDLGNDFDTF
jgi:hypothetical protein